MSRTEAQAEKGRAAAAAAHATGTVEPERGPEVAAPPDIDGIAAAAATAPLTAAADARCRDLVSDIVGCAVGGTASRDYVRIVGALQPVASSVRDRVLELACAAHVLDFDDTHAPSLCHISSVLLPALLGTAADMNESRFERVIDAYHFGTNVLGALQAYGLFLNGSLSHSTSVLGCICAAAACGHLRDPGGRTAAAAADAAAYLVQGVAGLNHSAGTLLKPLHVARAAEAAFIAARVASVPGAAMPSGALFGAGGLWHRLGCAHVPLAPVTGRAYEGIGLKPYPCCLLSHTTIDVMRRFRAETGIVDPAAIEHLRIVVNPLTRHVAHRTSIDEPTEGKFSLGYCSYFALTRGTVDLSTFGAGAYAEFPPAWFSRVEVIADPAMRETGCALEITCAGHSWSGAAAAARGSPAQPLSREEIRAKARANFAFAGKADAGAVLERAMAGNDALATWNALGAALRA